MDAQFANNAEDSDVLEAFESPSYQSEGVGLALSGGGYKAAAFHLGALIRLNEIGWLPKLSRVSSVSGGSIAAGFLGLKWKHLEFDAGVASNLKEVVTKPLSLFLTSANIDVFAALKGLAPWSAGADNVAADYAARLYGEASLQDLPGPGEGPQFMLLATNYELNSLWRFSRAYAADHRVGRIDSPDFPLARIVAASSAFPPFFCPLKLDLRKHPPQAMPGVDRCEGRYLQRALLCDGGVYDNMGLEPIWKEFGTLLVSNAGDLIAEQPLPGNWFTILLRIIGMIHRQAENNRQRVLMTLAQGGRRVVAYWPLRNTNNNYPNPSPTIPDFADIAAAQTQPVRLWRLTERALAQLANHGYSLCDSATRSYLGLAATAAPQLPFAT